MIRHFFLAFLVIHDLSNVCARKTKTETLDSERVTLRRRTDGTSSDTEVGKSKHLPIPENCASDGEIITTYFKNKVGKHLKFHPTPVDKGRSCCSGYCARSSSMRFGPGTEIDTPAHTEGGIGIQLCECGPVPTEPQDIHEDEAHVCTPNGSVAKAIFRHNIKEPRIFFPTPVDDGRACCSGHCVNVTMTSSLSFVPLVDEENREANSQKLMKMAGGRVSCFCGAKPLVRPIKGSII